MGGLPPIIAWRGVVSKARKTEDSTAESIREKQQGIAEITKKHGIINGRQSMEGDIARKGDCAVVIGARKRKSKY